MLSQTDLMNDKKVNHYQESLLNRIKTARVATFLANFEYKLSTRML